MGEKWTTVACAVGWERVALRVGNYVVGDGCAAGWKRMRLLGGRQFLCLVPPRIGFSKLLLK